MNSSNPVSSHVTIHVHSPNWTLARYGPAAARAQTRENELRRAQIDQQLDELARIEAALPLRNRRVRQCAAASPLLPFAASFVCASVGIARGDPSLVGYALIPGIAAACLWRYPPSCDSRQERDVAARRATLEGEAENLAAQVEQAELATQRANAAVQGVIVHQLKRHTPLVEVPLGIVADYVGTNEYEPQAQG